MMNKLFLSALLTTLGLAGFTFASEPGKVEPPSKTPAAQNAPAEPADMIPLFNGKDLTGWDGDTRLWSAKDGAIRGQTTKENPAKGNTFLIYKGGANLPPGELKDFELRFSVKLQGGNSGCQYRSKHFPFKETDANKWVVGGYQAEVAGLPGKDGFLYNEKGGKGRGYASRSNYLAWVGDKVEIGEDGISKVVGTLGSNGDIAATFKKGDWNDYIIIAKGNHLQHFINGVQTIDVIDNDTKNRLMSGIIALQIHAGPPMIVEFKNIRLKELK